MELDHDGAENTRYASQQLPTSPTSMDDSSRASSESSRVGEEKPQRVMDHDSLVTVRLSEPPYLHVDTNIIPNVLPSRKSLYGNDDTPSDSMAEAVKEDQDGADRWQEQEEIELTTHTPISINSDRSRSLQDELEEDDSPDDTDSIHSTLEDPDITQQNSNDTSATSHPRSSEETNWDQLQEIENLESKDQVSENVSTSPDL